MLRYLVFPCLLTLLLPSVSAAGRSSAGDWKEEVGIYNRVHDVPLQLVDHKNATLLRLAQDKPLLLALVFTRCSGICSPFLTQLKENLRSEAVEGEFDIVVVSFDPRDGIEDMAMLAERYDLQNDPRWSFGVTETIDELNRSIGFDPVWDDRRKQFDHDALLVGINRDGYITKKLLGIRSANDLALLVDSVNNVFSPTYRLPNPNILFSCFNYDPRTGKSRLGKGLLFIALPAFLTVLLLVGTSCLVGPNQNR